MATNDKLSTQAFFDQNPVFTLAHAANALQPKGGNVGMVHRLKHHVGTGRLRHVAREVYAVVPWSADSHRFKPDLFQVAHAMRPEGIFSYHSALELLGAAHSAWRQLVVVSGTRRTPFRLDGAEVLFPEHPAALVKKRSESAGVRKVERRGQLLRVTGPERTLVEGFRRPALTGGLAELVLSAAGFATLDLELLEHLLMLYGSATLWGAAGWFLEQYQEDFDVPGTLLARLEARRPKSAHYLLRGSRGGTLAARWNVIVPDDAVSLTEPDER